MAADLGHDGASPLLCRETVSLAAPPRVRFSCLAADATYLACG